MITLFVEGPRRLRARRADPLEPGPNRPWRVILGGSVSATISYPYPSETEVAGTLRGPSGRVYAIVRRMSASKATAGGAYALVFGALARAFADARYGEAATELARVFLHWLARFVDAVYDRTRDDERTLAAWMWATTREPGPAFRMSRLWSPDDAARWFIPRSAVALRTGPVKMEHPWKPIPFQGLAWEVATVPSTGQVIFRSSEGKWGEPSYLLVTDLPWSFESYIDATFMVPPERGISFAQGSPPPPLPGLLSIPEIVQQFRRGQGADVVFAADVEIFSVLDRPHPFLWGQAEFAEWADRIGLRPVFLAFDSAGEIPRLPP